MTIKAILSAAVTAATLTACGGGGGSSSAGGSFSSAPHGHGEYVEFRLPAIARRQYVDVPIGRHNHGRRRNPARVLVPDQQQIGRAAQRDGSQRSLWGRILFREGSLAERSQRESPHYVFGRRPHRDGDQHYA